MNAVNTFFEYFGGERITRIFRTYWMILLIIKQVMFSLFTAEPLTESAIMEHRATLGIDMNALNIGEEGFYGSHAVGVLSTLSQLDAEK
ncbi:hypothetical protein [Salinimicrobium sp. TH3]|uniref:hypothetical protein n=1 Tax=Salinimicrobium sp. TH3 TaxID=2997342 RepID=UPI002276D0F9|nr:hypothetical protein [Salinimicrobium sp. TH3]MCY2687610.1 hypothetical protein [Salinimicrobium sp. TH3]